MVTGYFVLYRTADGKVSPGEFVHKSEACAIAGIHLFEGREVYGVFPVTFDLNASLKVGLKFREDHAELVKTVT